MKFAGSRSLADVDADLISATHPSRSQPQAATKSIIMDIFLSEAEIELLEFADSCHPMAPDQIMLEPRLPANLEGIDGALEAKIALIESFFLLNGHLERDCFRVVYPHKLRTHQLVRMADLDPRRQDHERPETSAMSYAFEGLAVNYYISTIRSAIPFHWECTKSSGRQLGRGLFRWLMNEHIGSTLQICHTCRCRHFDVGNIVAKYPECPDKAVE